MSDTKPKCFIITPIGDDSDQIRRHIDGIIDAAITPAIGEKYEIRVAHKISDPGTITKQIISEIYNDELVIANITNRNPNVMYELAFRHTIGKPVIMICEKGTTLPADIIMERTIFYQNDAKGVLELKEDLIKAEATILFDAKGGPIFDILGDISHDTSVLQNTGSSEVKPMEYILQRLTKIEDAISVSNRNLNTRADRPGALRMRRLRFTYENTEHPIDENALYWAIITTLQPMGIDIKSFRFSSDDKQVLVNFTDKENRVFAIHKRLFTDILTSEGIQEPIQAEVL